MSQAKPMEFEHKIFCGTHRFYPLNISANHMCTLSQRKCLRSPDLKLMLYIGIDFRVLRDGKEIEYSEMMKIIESKFKEPKGDTEK